MGDVLVLMRSHISVCSHTPCNIQIQIYHIYNQAEDKHMSSMHPLDTHTHVPQSY